MVTIFKCFNSELGCFFTELAEAIRVMEQTVPLPSSGVRLNFRRDIKLLLRVYLSRGMGSGKCAGSISGNENDTTLGYRITSLPASLEILQVTIHTDLDLFVNRNRLIVLKTWKMGIWYVLHVL